MKLKTLVAVTVVIAVVSVFVPLPPLARLLFGVGALAFGIAAIITAVRKPRK